MGAQRATSFERREGERPSRLVVLVGPSGSGKTTLARRLIERHPQGCAFSVSHSTRPRRPSEVDGQDYHFVSRERFEALRDADGFAEWAEVHGNLYGTSMAELERHFGAGRDVLFDIDIVGAHNLARRFGGRCRLIFVLPPSWQVLVERLVARATETDQTLRRRLRTARSELQLVLASASPWSFLVNDNLETATTQLGSLIDAHEDDHDDARSPLVAAFLHAALADPRSADPSPANP